MNRPGQQAEEGPAPEERTVLTTRKQALALFVDRSSGRWIVRDPAGAFWALPSSDNAWEQRRPVELGVETELEPVPGHYKYLLGLPF